MKVLKIIFSIILFVLIIQILSFLTIGDRKMINAVGGNYESMLLTYPENKFDSFFFITNISTSEKQIRNKFTSE